MKSELLFTGASGFLGSNLKPLLINDFKVKTLGLTDKNDYKVNIATNIPELNNSFKVVLHAAGKAHMVPKIEKWLFRSISATLFGSNGATHFSLFRSSERSLAKLIILSVNV